MEVDAVKWITDVELAGEKNSRNLSRLNVQMDQVKADITEHRADSKERSDDRLEQIMARFDRLDSMTSKRVGMALSFFVACCTAIWFTVVEPMQERIAVLERRMYETERNVSSTSTDP